MRDVALHNLVLDVGLQLRAQPGEASEVLDALEAFDRSLVQASANDGGGSGGGSKRASGSKRKRGAPTSAASADVTSLVGVLLRLLGTNSAMLRDAVINVFRSLTGQIDIDSLQLMLNALLDADDAFGGATSLDEHDSDDDAANDESESGELADGSGSDDDETDGEDDDSDSSAIDEASNGDSSSSSSHADKANNTKTNSDGNNNVNGGKDDDDDADDDDSSSVSDLSETTLFKMDKVLAAGMRAERELQHSTKLDVSGGGGGAGWLAWRGVPTHALLCSAPW